MSRPQLIISTIEELNELKEEVENLNRKLAELTEEELTQVSGGFEPGSYAQIRLPTYAINYEHENEEQRD